jgi:hypothetical protein
MDCVLSVPRAMSGKGRQRRSDACQKRSDMKNEAEVKSE